MCQARSRQTAGRGHAPIYRSKMEDRMKHLWMASCAAGVMLAAPVYAFDGWHVESATQIENKNAGFDYISYDGTANRLFLGHRKEGLQVFDLKTKKMVKTIDGTPGHSSNGALLLPEYDLGIAN